MQWSHSTGSGCQASLQSGDIWHCSGYRRGSPGKPRRACDGRSWVCLQEEMEKEGVWDFNRLSEPYIRCHLLQVSRSLIPVHCKLLWPNACAPPPCLPVLQCLPLLWCLALLRCPPRLWCPPLVRVCGWVVLFCLACGRLANHSPRGTVCLLVACRRCLGVAGLSLRPSTSRSTNTSATK